MMYPSSASSSSAHSASVRVEKATSEFLNGPDWTINIDICDSINLNHWFVLYPFLLYLCEFNYWLFKKIQSRRWKDCFFIHGFWFLVSMCECNDVFVCVYACMFWFGFLILCFLVLDDMKKLNLLGFLVLVNRNLDHF